MDHRDEALPRFGLRWRRLLTDLSIIAALALCQTWGSTLLQAGSTFRGGLLAAGALVLAFQIGKSLGARRGTANL